MKFSGCELNLIKTLQPIILDAIIECGSLERKDKKPIKIPPKLLETMKKESNGI